MISNCIFRYANKDGWKAEATKISLDAKFDIQRHGAPMKNKKKSIC